MPTLLEDQEVAALVPGIFWYEVPNGLGKAIRTCEVPVDEKLLELALDHNLAVYDASYLSLALTREMSIATVDGKLQNAARGLGISLIKP